MPTRPAGLPRGSSCPRPRSELTLAPSAPSSFLSFPLTPYPSPHKGSTVCVCSKKMEQIRTVLFVLGKGGVDQGAHQDPKDPRSFTERIGLQNLFGVGFLEGAHGSCGGAAKKGGFLSQRTRAALCDQESLTIQVDLEGANIISTIALAQATEKAWKR